METLNFSIEAGEGAQPQDLEDRLRVVDEKVRRDAREIVEVLRIDLPLFVKREARQRFVAAGAFADSLDKAKLHALKDDVEATAATAGREIAPLLEDWSLWLEGPKAASGPGERRDLSGNPEIQSRIQRVGDHLRGLYERHGFPDVKPEELKEPYKLPTWFISGRLLVSLVESYWRNVEEYRAIREAVAAIKERDQRWKRAERWDSA
jgi:hypothetical protein